MNKQIKDQITKLYDDYLKTNQTDEDRLKFRDTLIDLERNYKQIFDREMKEIRQLVSELYNKCLKKNSL